MSLIPPDCDQDTILQASKEAGEAPKAINFGAPPGRDDHPGLTQAGITAQRARQKERFPSLYYNATSGGNTHMTRSKTKITKEQPGRQEIVGKPRVESVKESRNRICIYLQCSCQQY